MRLTDKAIHEIKANKRLRNRLAFDLDKSAMTILRWVSTNDDNLTKAAALQVIREETGFTDEEILEVAVA